MGWEDEVARLPNAPPVESMKIIRDMFLTQGENLDRAGSELIPKIEQTQADVLALKEDVLNLKWEAESLRQTVVTVE